MNNRRQVLARHLIAYLLIITLLPSSALAGLKPQLQPLGDLLQFLPEAETMPMKQVLEGWFKEEKNTYLTNHSERKAINEKPFNATSIVQPTHRPQSGDSSFFNGPIVFTTMMENATKPACGCNGEPTYSQGISLVAQERTKCESVGSFPGIAQDTGQATVFLHNGEFFLYQVDLEIKGRGFNWKFERKYRSGIKFEGPLGHNWEFNYNRRLFIETDSNILRMDGYGRADRYKFNGSTFESPVGFYTQLRRNSDGTFIERDKNGTKVFYSAPDDQKICRMTELRDRNGNRMRFIYNEAKQLIEVIETLGRSIRYRYNDRGHLIEVEDFFGRKIKFQYNDERNTARTGPGDLIAVTSPEVTGTPNGNNFPDGKTTRYRYNSDFADQKLNHNMVEIIAPNEVAASGRPRVSVEYDNSPASPNIDRVLNQSIGGTNASGVAAGGTISYEYQSLGTAQPGAFTTPVFQTRVRDRNGNLTEYQFNQLANIVRVREFTNRNIRRGDPDFFETRYEYNKDGEMTRMILPEGNSVESSYDELNPSRFLQGNLLSQTRRPDARRAGDQAFIRTSSTYEPIYNHIRTQTEPRGNDPAHVPQNGGTRSAERYTTANIFDYQEGMNFAALAQELGVSVADVMQLLVVNNIPMGLGDVNGDGRTDQIAGNVVKVMRPTVNLLPDSNMARLEGNTRQPIVELYRYNQFGQLTRQVDAESNVDTFEYHPENDPDGDKLNPTPGVTDGPFGYLKQQIIDAESNSIRDTGTNPKPAAIKHTYFYDPVGNLIKEVDGRRIATSYSVNQLNQVVEIRRAADVSEARANMEEPKWDQCADATLIECRVGMKEFNYRISIFYDHNNNFVKRGVENRDSNNVSLAGDFVDHTFVYDILDNLIEERKEVSENPPELLVTKYRYDRNENRVLEITPVANLPAGNIARQPSNVFSFVFDERDLGFTSTRGGLTVQFRALLAHSDILEAGLIPNSPDISTNERDYDGNRNVTRTVDCADNSRDARPEVTLTLFDGFDRAQSVIDAVGNQSFTRYDPASNVVSEARFGPVGGRSPANNLAATLRLPLRREDIGQPLLSQAEFKFDELSRMFERNDLLFDYRNQGVRYIRTPVLRDGPLGQSNDGLVVTRHEHDRNSRRRFLIEDDLDTFQTIYDGADRTINEIDPEGNKIAREYDDDNNVVKVIKTEFTQRKDVEAHRVPGLEETFTTINVYDWLNRLIRTTDNLGQTTRYEYDSRDNLIRTSDAQHSNSGAGLIADPLGLFPMTGQSGDRINRAGNTMDYVFDGQSRNIAEVHQLRIDGQGINAIDMSNPANPDGLIVIDQDWDANSRLVAMADDGSSAADQNTSIGVIEPVNPKGNVTRYDYDDLNRLKQEVFDDGTIKDYSYDCDDNPIRVIDQNGTIITRRFDAINRLVEVNVNRATSRTAHRAGGFKDPNVKWNITGTTLQRLEYDGLSRLTLSFDNNDPGDLLDDQPVKNAYDSMSRLLEEIQCEFPVSSRWAGDNNRVGLVYPNGRTIEITFDKLDRIDTISDANQSTSSPQGPIVDYNYIGTYRVLERTYANGVRLTRLNANRTEASGFDRLRRLVSHRHINRQSSLIAGFDYSYDRASNKLSETESQGMSLVRAESYEYDSAYRLTKFARQGEDEDNWKLDGVGNWAMRRNLINEVNNMNEYTVFRRSTGTTAGATAGVPLQSGSAQLSDDNGNLLDDGTNLYEFDFANRLRKVTRKSDRAVVAVYLYYADNRRFQATVTNSRRASANLNDRVRYFYDGWREIQESGSGATQQYVYGIWIDEPLTLDIDANNDGRIEPGDTVGDGDGDRFNQDKRFFYSEDGKRYISALTDNRGIVVERYRYDAYGVPTITDAGGAERNQSIVNNRYLFNARRFDPESELYYYRNRYMNPHQGRFISRDPDGLWASRLNNGNAYAYIGSNPVNLNDPSGHARIGANWPEQPGFIQLPRYTFMPPGGSDPLRRFLDCTADCLTKELQDRNCNPGLGFNKCTADCWYTGNAQLPKCLTLCANAHCSGSPIPDIPVKVDDCLGKCRLPEPPSPSPPKYCPDGMKRVPNCDCPPGKVYYPTSNTCGDRLDWDGDPPDLSQIDEMIRNSADDNYYPRPSPRPRAPWER
jgi:RHS repeat-associated protein